MPRVTITLPEKTPQPYRFSLNREVVTIGRSPDNDIVAGCGSVSGKHSEMHRVKGGYQLIDVGSTNGLKIDGIRQQTVILHTGMSVMLGDVEFRFSLSEDELAVLASEAEPVPAPVAAEEEAITDKAVKTLDDDDDDDLDKLPEAPPVKKDKDRREEKRAENAEKAEKEKRAKAEKEKKAKAERAERAEREDSDEETERPRRRDDYSESKAATIGSGFILFLLIAVAAAFFYGANTRHEKDTGESLLKAAVNKEDYKNDSGAEDEADGDSE